MPELQELISLIGIHLPPCFVGQHAQCEPSGAAREQQLREVQ
jgi:hypothetical protein